MTLSQFTKWRGRKVRAIDGLIGTVSDFYFDDGSWNIRMLRISS